MKYTNLPQTNIEVSKICLGTMTWGNQNTTEDAFEQMNYAVEQGINFFDTAELYAVPMSPETYGFTEKFIGKWFKKTGKRNEIILATKACGPGPKHIRNSPKFTNEQLTQALNQSLERLQTEYIDLYQLHWPERDTPRFGILNYEHSEKEFENLQSVLETLQYFIKSGKVRHIGISNETPWGMMKYLQLAEKYDLPKYITIQNPYSLINRVFEIGHSEICHRENVGLLAYSPLGGGMLSGKYRNGNRPEGTRYNLFPNYFGRYNHENTTLAMEEYCKLAEKHNLTPTQFSLAFVNTRPFLTSTIIGATSMEQLKENIATIDIDFTSEMKREADKINLKYQNPAP